MKFIDTRSLLLFTQEWPLFSNLGVMPPWVQRFFSGWKHLCWYNSFICSFSPGKRITGDVAEFLILTCPRKCLFCLHSFCFEKNNGVLWGDAQVRLNNKRMWFMFAAWSQWLQTTAAWKWQGNVQLVLLKQCGCVGSWQGINCEVVSLLTNIALMHLDITRRITVFQEVKLQRLCRIFGY